MRRVSMPLCVLLLATSPAADGLHAASPAVAVPAGGYNATGRRQLLLGRPGPNGKGWGWKKRLAPVLARLSQIEGVENSFANEPGSLVGLTLGPGADPRQVAREAQRALREEAVERGTAPPREEQTAPLSGPAATAALQAGPWHDREEVARQAAEILAAEGRASGPGFPWLLLALLLLCAAVGLWALRRRRRAAED